MINKKSPEPVYRTVPLWQVTSTESPAASAREDNSAGKRHGREALLLSPWYRRSVIRDRVLIR